MNKGLKCLRKISTTQLLVYRLTVSYAPLGNSVRTKSIWSSWRPAAGIVLLGDKCKVSVCRGAWRYAFPARRPGSLLLLAPRDLCQAMIAAAELCCAALVCVVYKASRIF